MISSVSFQRPTEFNDLFESDVGGQEGRVGPRGPRDVVIYLRDICIWSLNTVLVLLILWWSLSWLISSDMVLEDVTEL